MKKLFAAYLFSFLALLNTMPLTAQTGKDGAGAIMTADSVVNAYSRVIANVAAGDTFVTVLSLSEFDNLEYGDLVMLIQMQGASISTGSDKSWGAVSSLNSAGLYEFAYVKWVDQYRNQVYFCSGVANNYTATGKIQLIQVPQYTSVTISGVGSITAPSWNGITGGVVAVHATGTVTVNGSITVEGKGFRGGVRDNTTSGAGATLITTVASTSQTDGAEKGEGIAGFYEEYDAAGGRYSRGAPANGGGGGNGHNAGGGGGANAGSLSAWNGYGVMNSGLTGATAFALDPGYIWNGNAYTNSSGGGRGGYTYASANGNALTLSPGNSAWGGDYRDTVGGYGGRPIDGYSLDDRLFLGGGGGAGDGNNSASFDGSNGGGIVVIFADAITGTGSVNADGADAFPTISGGNDAPGGGGAGGTIVMEAASSISTLSLYARGGEGGDQIISGNESEGPGGGGGGGVIATNSPSVSGITRNADGGASGTSNSASVTEFPTNGATEGADGLTTESVDLAMPALGCSAPDWDSDGVVDADDIDDDNDGLPDLVERSVTITSYTGSGSAVTSSANVTNSSNILGAVDGSFAQFNNASSALVLQLPSELPIGTLINIVWRRNTTASFPAQLNLALSADNVTYRDHDARYFRTYSTNWVTVTTPVTSATEYVRLTQIADDGTLTDFQVDAVYFSFTSFTSENPDHDNDGIPNYLDLDSDNDGIADLAEAGGTDADGNGKVDAATDTDGDGLANTYDNDDADGPDVSGCTPGVDCDLSASTSSLFDTNNDGTNDNDRDTDGDGTADYRDPDSDNDGILDNIEAQSTASYTALTAGDSDNDGTLNAFEAGFLTPVDTDGTGTPDFQDTDSDDDGILDTDEAWDAFDDGDTVNDFACGSTDTDGDGLLDCYDQTDADPTHYLVGVTPPNDNGFDGSGYTDSQASAGTTPATIFPNNGGVAGEPDWRDDQTCSLTPGVVYPITGTSYLYNSNTEAHDASGGAVTGSIRTGSFCDDVGTAGWRYYFPAMEPDKVMFAINHGSNTTRIDYIELRRESLASRKAVSGSQGHFVMARDWFVTTVEDAALTSNVSVRFYFDPGDSTATQVEADAFVTEKGGIKQGVVWFKVNDPWTSVDIQAGAGLSEEVGYTILTPSSFGEEAGRHYVQFDNISSFSGGGMLVEVEGTLPVEWLHFGAQEADGGVELTWSTASEEGSDFFAIERKAAKGEFTEIARISSAGYSQSPTEYAYADQTAWEAGRQLVYRLRQVDFNGSVSFSQTVEVTLSDHQLGLFLSPNPARDQVVVTGRIQPDKPYTLTLMDAQGRLLQTWTAPGLGNGKLEKQITVGEWTSGLYFLHIQQEGWTSTQVMRIE